MRVNCIALFFLFRIAGAAPTQDYNENEAQKVNLEKRFIALAPAVIGTAISAAEVGRDLLMNYLDAKTERKTTKDFKEEMEKTRDVLRSKNVEQSIVDGFDNSLSKVIHGVAEMRAHKANEDYKITTEIADSVYDAVLEDEWNTMKAEIDESTSEENKRKKKYEAAQQTLASKYVKFETEYLLATLKAQEAGKPAPTPDYDALQEHEWRTMKAKIDKSTPKGYERQRKYDTAKITLAVKFDLFKSKYFLATSMTQETGKPAPTPDKVIE